jgi:hypothetical protein
VQLDALLRQQPSITILTRKQQQILQRQLTAVKYIVLLKDPFYYLRMLRGKLLACFVEHHGISKQSVPCTGVVMSSLHLLIGFKLGRVINYSTFQCPRRSSTGLSYANCIMVASICPSKLYSISLVLHSAFRSYYHRQALHGRQ